jgi:hypothetical protein
LKFWPSREKPPVRERDAPIVIGASAAGPAAPALGLLLLPLHAARTPTESATALIAMTFLENQGRLDLTARFLLPRLIRILQGRARPRHRGAHFRGYTG